MDDTRLCDRLFAVTGPLVWNISLALLRLVDNNNYTRFKRLSKAHLFDWDCLGFKRRVYIFLLFLLVNFIFEMYLLKGVKAEWMNEWMNENISLPQSTRYRYEQKQYIIIGKR